MANEQSEKDDNLVPSLLLESSVTPGDTVAAKGNPTTGAQLVELPSGAQLVEFDGAQPVELDPDAKVEVDGTHDDGDANTTKPVVIGGEAQDPTNLPGNSIIGKVVRFFTDRARRLIVTLGTVIAGEDFINHVMRIEGQFSYNTISTATTTVIKDGAGHLRRMFVAGGTLGDVTVYDSITASGTEIQATATPVSGGVLLEDLDFNIGLTVVTVAATVINTSYR